MASLSKQTLRPGLRTTAGGVLADHCVWNIGFVRGTSRVKACAGRPQRFSEAVGAMHRLPCDARGRGPSHNSLRSLRSLRSNKCDESDNEARCARGHGHCASRRLTGALRPARTRLGQHGVGALPVESHFISCCGRRCPVGAISGAAVTASLGPGAPVRASFLTRGHCLSGESAANAASLAAPAPGWWAQRSRRFSADRPSMSPRRAAPAAAREVLRTRTAARPALHPKKAKGKTLKSLTPSPTHPMAPGWKSTRTRRPPSAGEVSSCSVAPCRSATALTMASPRPLPAEAASGTR